MGTSTEKSDDSTFGKPTSNSTRELLKLKSTKAAKPIDFQVFL
jgi:hypothetical protein